MCVKGKASGVVVIYGGMSDDGGFARYSGSAEKADLDSAQSRNRVKMSLFEKEG